MWVPRGVRAGRVVMWDTHSWNDEKYIKEHLEQNDKGLQFQRPNTRDTEGQGKQEVLGHLMLWHKSVGEEVVKQDSVLHG